MWQLVCIANASLPRLAWCARVTDRSSEVIVEHGPWVEAGDTHFVEGAWSGPFREMAFAVASTFAGSGGVLTPSGLLLATPTHTLDPLYMSRVGKHVFCANSLQFLLSSMGDDTDHDYPYYDADMMSIVFGLRRCQSKIPTRSGNRVSLHYYCNILVAENLALTVLPKRRHGPFYSYSDYRGFLAQEVAQTISNAADPGRSARYAPLATISTGYDSSACAVLARDAGCTDAITFVTGRDELGRDADDSGKHIGEVLGLRVTEHDHTAYRARDDLPEAEFLATGAGAGDVILAALEERLQQRLMVTGFYGDSAWERIDNAGGDDMAMSAPASGGMANFRMRVGFLHLPGPSIGYIEHRSIQEICNSREMRPWSLERTRYDRPIPRRIVEEAGIPRCAFGQTKKAAAMPHLYSDPYTLPDPDLVSIMSPASYRDFQEWIESKQLFRDRFDRLFFFGMHALYRLNVRMLRNQRVNAAARRLGMRLPSMPWVPVKFAKRRTPHRLLFHWGMDRLRRQYFTRPGGAH
jgi:hypothetical protein